MDITSCPTVTHISHIGRVCVCVSLRVKERDRVLCALFSTHTCIHMYYLHEWTLTVVAEANLQRTTVGGQTF